ncbi:MAG: TrkA family potassium uptake protein [Victivallales bacterium]|jgi:trk system potassium uptake protein|nr:TrkA family potassium uptake protein [Victivallales bacterium]MBT7161896.1 TrkA family potassium uptake protein [Victivallales bacterium]MBT7300043.1 TrkA family potassium uptake protein [Victivallales bacterium]
MKRQIAVIGLGIFGRQLAVSLSQRGFSVMAIDNTPEPVDEIKDEVAQALVLDTTNEHALLEAKVDEMEVVVNAIGTQHIENSILTTALLRQLGVAHIIARATAPLHARILRQVGAHEVVNPEEDMARKLAHQLARPGLREVLPLAEDVCVAELPVPASFVGKTLGQLEVRRRYRVNVIGVQRIPGEGRERRMTLNVSPNDDPFQEGDALVVIGRDEDVDRLGGLG